MKGERSGEWRSHEEDRNRQRSEEEDIRVGVRKPGMKDEEEVEE